MDTIEAILTRRSIRRYTSQPISEEITQILLKAGMQAPSTRNCQPWHFVVFTDRTLMDIIPTFHPYAKSMLSAPLAILVCGDDKLTARPNGWRVDCSAAIENILLAAHALGLGAVWMAIDPDAQRLEGMRRLVQFPSEVTPFGLISIGYPDEKPVIEERFNPQRVHYNKW